MAKIEEQQKAIHNLKSNLMDDLNEKGILSDPECQRVIQVHQKEQEKLNENTKPSLLLLSEKFMLILSENFSC